MNRVFVTVPTKILLYIRTSQLVLCTPFSTQNHLFWHFHIFFASKWRQKIQQKRRAELGTLTHRTFHYINVQWNALYKQRVKYKIQLRNIMTSIGLFSNLAGMYSKRDQFVITFTRRYFGNLVPKIPTFSLQPSTTEPTQNRCIYHNAYI